MSERGRSYKIRKSMSRGTPSFQLGNYEMIGEPGSRCSVFRVDVHLGEYASAGEALSTWPEEIRRLDFKPLLKRAGLPDIRWHDLRHTYATLLLSRDTHPTYVQKSLGHASVQLTLDRYSHWMPSMGRNTAEGIDEALG
jgi:hypothetical protein